MAIGPITGIYQIQNTANGKLYIGSAVHVTSRWNRHKHDLRNGKHHSVKLQRAWDKYGEEAFIFSLLLECKAEDLMGQEQAQMDKVNASSLGYNVLPMARSSLGSKHSEATKAKLSEVVKCRVYSAETRTKLSNASKGRRQTPESIAKTRAAILGVPKSKEAVAKMVAALTGRKLSSEHRASIGKGLEGGRHSEETKRKMAESRRLWRERKRNLTANV